jgi:hypothetical protein
VLCPDALRYTSFCTAAICGYVCSVIEVLLPILPAVMLGTNVRCGLCGSLESILKKVTCPKLRTALGKVRLHAGVLSCGKQL